MKKVILGIVMLVVVAGFCAILLPEQAPSESPTTADTEVSALIETFEQKLAEKNVVLIQANMVPAKTDAPLRVLTYSAAQLASQPLYLKHPKENTYACFAGPSHALPDDNNIHTVNDALTLSASTDMVRLVVDDKVTELDYASWNAYWISPKDKTTAPIGKAMAIEAGAVKDGFMRKTLKDGTWVTTEGGWRLKQYGGGLASSPEQVKSYNFQRAVNPFAVTGHGILSYGDKNWVHSRGSANFYFGKPWKVGAVDKETLPKGLILTAFGDAAGALIGFGWDGRSKRFCILERPDPDAEWTYIAERTGPRPAISNWVSIGLQIRNGLVAEGVLDGVVVLSVPLDRLVRGTFHVVTSQTTEFDDFAIAPLQVSESKGNPVFIRSKQFAGKQEKGKSDPEEFGKWARGESAFLRTILPTKDGKYNKAVFLTKWPMMGDFTYESIPEATGANGQKLTLPYGLYEFEILTNPRDGIPIYKDMVNHFRRRLVYDETGWSDAAGPDEGINGEPVLRIRRLAARENVIEIQTEGSYDAVSYRIDGPVHVAMSRVLPRAANLLHPRPENHMVYSKNLVNELFENTPINWSWIDGGFRMDCRWACQNRWNFMACGSKDLSMLVSKRQFFGDQEHEYYMSLRPVFPSDAGDAAFTYSPALHRNLLLRFGGWYVRRDLCFSFCMDGRNPLSGYSLVFGANNNTETQLLRKGKVVATTQSALFPKSEKILTVHWEWWAFSIRRYGSRIIVLYKDKPIFDYVDPDPLPGGHLAYWTVRNGFTVSKAVSAAERIEWKPDVLYVDQDDDSPWQPLVPDAVTLTRTVDNQTKVTANVGGGSAVRYTFIPPIIIKLKPIMTLPLQIPDGVKVNLHLHIDRKAKLIQINAPITKCKSLLTPEFEPDYNFWAKGQHEVLEEMRRNEFFKIPEISEATMKKERLLGSATLTEGHPLTLDLSKLLGTHQGLLLRSITIGNSSNEDYLLVGNGANAAGSSFIVGEPTFDKAESP